MKNVFVIKLQVFPVGDKEEKDRIYTYYHDAEYNQYLALNQLMSMTGALYYQCHRDFKSENFRTQYKEIFKRNSIAFENITFPKGSHFQGVVSRKVQSDFSIALKNGLAKGERQLPRYRRDFPYMIAGSEIKLYDTETEGKTKFYIKTVNKMYLEIYMGTGGKKDYRKTDVLKKLCDGNPAYKICTSSLYFIEKKMMLNLCISQESEEKNTDTIKGRSMGVAFGYGEPLKVAFNDSDETFSIGDMDYFLEKRQRSQQKYQRLQSALKEARGGRGRSHKLKALNQYKKTEKNFVKNYNHMLSKGIIDLAKEKKVERIVLEKINSTQIKEDPVVLRNWSYYQLQEFVSYKAKRESIAVDIQNVKEDSNYEEGTDIGIAKAKYLSMIN